MIRSTERISTRCCFTTRKNHASHWLEETWMKFWVVGDRSSVMVLKKIKRWPWEVFQFSKNVIKNLEKNIFHKKSLPNRPQRKKNISHFPFSFPHRFLASLFSWTGNNWVFVVVIGLQYVRAACLEREHFSSPRFVNKKHKTRCV